MPNMSTVAKIVTYVLRLLDSLTIFILVGGAHFIEPMGNNVVLLLDNWGFPALITRKFAATKLVTVLIFGIFCPQGLPRPWFRPFCAEAIHCCRLISSLKEDAHAVHNDFGW